MDINAKGLNLFLHHIVIEFLFHETIVYDHLVCNFDAGSYNPFSPTPLPRRIQYPK